MSGKCPNGKKWSEGKNYCIEEFPCASTGAPTKAMKEECSHDITRLDPRSIRTKTITTDKGGYKDELRIGCPKGHWDESKQRCKVGTVATQMLHPKSEPLKQMTDKDS